MRVPTRFGDDAKNDENWNDKKKKLFTQQLWQKKRSII